MTKMNFKYLRLIFIMFVISLSTILFSQVFTFEDNASIDYKNQNKNTAKYQTMKHKDKKLNLSAGIADSRTGMSFLGLSYKIFQKNNNETYIGLGTAIFVVNLSFGWKRYWSNKKRSPYTSFSIQAVSKLFDADGYIIGINTLISDTAAENIAVSADHIKDLLYNN